MSIHEGDMRPWPGSAATIAWWMLAAALPATAGYDADDNNSGFMTTMKFARGAYPDQKIVLTEKSSERISEQKGHLGSREKTTTTFSKTHHYKRLGWTGKPEADIVMECIEYQLTAP
jgi:hypothetical protein